MKYVQSCRLMPGRERRAQPRCRQAVEAAVAKVQRSIEALGRRTCSFRLNYQCPAEGSILRDAEFLRDMVAREVTVPRQVSSADQLADGFTKALPRLVFLAMRDRLVQPTPT